MTSAPSKIHLQLRELRYLYDTLQESAAAKVETHLKQVGSKKQDPALSESVSLVVRQFVDQVFDSIQFSLDLDDVSPAQLDKYKVSELLTNPDLLNEKIEPYDFALNDRLRDLYTRVEEKIGLVAQLRRTQPIQVYEEYQTEIDNNTTLIDTIISESMANRARAQKTSETVPSYEPDESVDTLKRDFQAILADLADLKHDIPEMRRGVDNLDSVITFVGRSQPSDRAPQNA
ncbi:hypothetical protein OGAPHI_006476 [Ogataea philodendri]|uniref:Uncharacterized protein n=1 Tax=Ogataea philodendri TaxID=1378263 RepID=A0A9P8NY63_9ASCO|nr:uncharacterized protein OGAPHI_006476 [Ogataea philodendri]KAH3661627.1 hypothetical protein OGAPHI_006476 [Ogataea philodendri]